LANAPDLQFWLLGFILVTAYFSVSLILSASAPVKVWLLGSGEKADTLSGATVARNLAMICVSVLIFVLTGMNNLIVLIPLTALVYWSGKGIMTSPKEKAFWICLSVIIFVTVVFCYNEYYVYLLLNRMISNLNALPLKNVMLVPGISYLILRVIHFSIECYRKRIKDLDFLTFLNYILFFPSFFGGPLIRYNQFSEDIYNSSVSIDYVGGIRRIIEGFFKKVVLCRFLLPYLLANTDLVSPSLTRTRVILGLYAYMFHVYFHFSGYTDISIGCGKLLGINLPENFNKPFLKKNLQQFWVSWNMTVTSWLTEYIYWPVAGKTRDIQQLRTRPILSASMAIIVTFVVCGMWHWATINFIVWGIYNGVGLSILNCYRSFRKKHFSRKWKDYVTSSWYAGVASTVLTFQFVAFGFLILRCDFKQIEQLWYLFLR